MYDVTVDDNAPFYHVYGGTQDVLRGVSEHVAVGRAFKGGKPMDNWFVLCRVG